MAVEDFGKQNMVEDMEEDDDDDKPLVFKRSSNHSAKQNQSNAEAHKSSIQRRDQESGRPKSEARSLNGQSTPKSQSVKSPPLATPKSSNSSAKASSIKSPEVNSKPSTSVSHEPKLKQIKEEKLATEASGKHNEDSDDSEDDKPLSTRLSSSLPNKNSNQGNKGLKASNLGQKPKPKHEDPDDDKPLGSKFSAKNTVGGSSNKGLNASNLGQKPKPKAEDSDDDDKPLGSRFSAKNTVGASSNKGLNASNLGQKPKPKTEDSDDDNTPLCSRFSAKNNVGASTSNKGLNASNLGQKLKPKPEDSDDDRPLGSRFSAKNNNVGASTSKSGEKKPLLGKTNQNGSAPMEVRPSNVIKKRPADRLDSASQPSSKKPKLLDTSTPNKNKVSSIKDEKKEEDDEDHTPISQRIKKSTSSDKKPSSVKNFTRPASSISKKTVTKSKKFVKTSKYSKSSKLLPSSGDGPKWTTLVHNGVIFPPPYKPHGVKMLYKGKPVDLTPEQEEVATMYAVMLETEYMSKPQFKENFMSDWRKILGKNHIIQSLDHCDFTPIYEWHQNEKEKKKQMSTDEKKALKEEKLKQEEKYMWAVVDGVKEKVGNFRVEPPGLFRGRGEHPKMGKLKKRIRPSDIIINIGKDAPVPECPIPGESWKEVRHDNSVTWLAYWIDPINAREFKYVFLAASSTLKGQSDQKKYEKARVLKDHIQRIRRRYTEDFQSKDPTKKQIAVATYLIDKLALRAGNEKDDDEADTVGCCTLKVENVEPVPPNILKFDFLGKDSIRYQNEVEVETLVFKAIQQFRNGKKGGDDLFDKLDTSKLNAHLKTLMPDLTAKVFRTYNASITLDDMLNKETKGGDVAENVVVYQHANKQVAIICNHQRTVSKSHSAQMSRLDEKIDELKGLVEELKTDLTRAKKGKPPTKSADGKPKRNMNPDALERKISQTNAKIEKMERDKETKEDLKTVALGTSKINYLDPRITVAWCKRKEVPIEKIFNKSLLAKFAWAMDVEPDFRF